MNLKELQRLTKEGKAARMKREAAEAAEEKAKLAAEERQRKLAFKALLARTITSVEKQIAQQAAKGYDYLDIMISYTPYSEWHKTENKGLLEAIEKHFGEVMKTSRYSKTVEICINYDMGTYGDETTDYLRISWA